MVSRCGDGSHRTAAVPALALVACALLGTLLPSLWVAGDDLVVLPPPTRERGAPDAITPAPSLADLHPLLESWSAEPDVDTASCVAHCVARNAPRPDRLVTADCAPRLWWCSANFSPAIIAEFCATLCENQFPRNCSTARFLIMTAEFENGFGADLHVRFVMLTQALSERRVLAYSPLIRTPWAYARDDDSDCARQQVGCYWLPITHCALPPDWQQRAEASTGSRSRPSAAQFTTMANFWVQGSYRARR